MINDTCGPATKALSERVFFDWERPSAALFSPRYAFPQSIPFLTSLYLAVILPVFGISLPLTKTMIVVTFVVGLLPVVGNLVSNTVIFIVSLAHSPLVAASSLGFLIIIHKLEYFLNARSSAARFAPRRGNYSRPC